MSGNLQAVGAYLRRLRQEKKLTVTNVASEFGTGESHMRRIELGRIDTRFSMMIELCDFLEGDISDISVLLLSEQATPERAIRLAEQHIASREHQAAVLAENGVEYEANGEG
jgi:transcriptional regulator with XRE-family HTH domain